MIQATTEFTTANEELAKSPIYVVEIANYPYALTNQKIDPYSNFGLPNATRRTITSGTFHVLASYSVADYGGWADLRFGSEGIFTFNISEIYTNEPFEKHWIEASLPTEVIDSLNSGGDSPMLFSIQGGVLGDGDCEFRVYDAYFSATFADESEGVVRPFTASQIVSTTGTVTGAENAIDLSTDTCAVVTRLHFSGTSNSPYLRLSNWREPASYIVRPWIESIDDFTVTVNDLDGGSSLGELSFEVVDYQNLLTADFPGFVFEGKPMRLRTGFPGMMPADYLTIFTGVVDSVASSGGNTSYTFACVDNKQGLSKVIYTEGDDGFATDSDHLRTLNGHPIDILLHILRTECGYPDDQILVSHLEDYRDSIFAGVQVTFSLDSPPAAKDFIEAQIMKPLGGYMRVDNLGRIGANFFYPLADELVSVMTLDKTNLAEVPQPQQADLINTVSFRFDKVEDKYRAQSLEVYGKSADLYGQFGEQVIESDGVKSAFQGYFLAALTSRMIFLRYGMKNLKLEVPVLWNACVLEDGDLVNVTHELVPDRTTGVMGIANWMMLVLDRTYNFTACTVSVTLVDASLLAKFGRYKIAPDATPNWPDASEYEQGRYMFYSDNDGQYSDNSAAHQLG